MPYLCYNFQVSIFVKHFYVWSCYDGKPSVSALVILFPTYLPSFFHTISQPIFLEPGTLGTYFRLGKLYHVSKKTSPNAPDATFWAGSGTLPRSARSKCSKVRPLGGTRKLLHFANWNMLICNGQTIYKYS